MKATTPTMKKLMSELSLQSVNPKEFHWQGKPDARQHAFSQPHVGLFELSNAGGPRHLELPLIDASSHHIIVGNNLDALKIFKQHDQLKFNFIYIDPPYNTGQKLSFNDSMNMTPGVDAECQWLSMMYARLLAAREVMAEDGFLFISIDDRQCAELLLILQEVFGKQNHIGTLKWRKKRKASFLDQHLSNTIEYIIVVAKDRTKAPKLLGEQSTEQTRPVLNASNQICQRIIRCGTKAYCKDGTYKLGLFQNRTLSFELLNELKIENGFVVNDVRCLGRFRVSQEIVDKSLFITKNFGLRRTVEEGENKRRHASDDATTWPTNEDADSELRKHFNERVFTYPKPIGLIQNLLRMCTVNSTKPYLCLDFFAGSATLAEAVLAQNNEDNANRVFFCVQTREQLPKPFPALGIKDIAELAMARAKKACEQYNESKTLKFIELAQP